MRVLVTGSSGLIGSKRSSISRQGHEVVAWITTCGACSSDGGDTLWNLERLKSVTKRFTHAALTFATARPSKSSFEWQRID